MNVSGILICNETALLKKRIVAKATTWHCANAENYCLDPPISLVL